jgi:hypothetical protein
MANYTFLPFLRRGIVGLAKDNVEKNRFNVPVRLRVIGEGETPPAPIEKPVQLYGPGDVTGVNHQAIIRTVPRAGVNDFEANFLASIEFYEEDFPWRYTPVIPEQGGKLIPWLWLVVLSEHEYVRIKGGKNSLPIISISPEVMPSAFPLSETTISWAHVQLNFKPEGNTANELGTSIQQRLDENSNLGCSRLVCPRRLSPNTRYIAFVIPTFEKGRLAGLGRPEAEVGNIPNGQISWSNAVGAADAHQFPVYFEWPFSTSSNGDFEDLARRLSPLTIEEQKDLIGASKHLDVRNPGWGIKGATGTIRLESALKVPGLPEDSENELNDKKILRAKIAPLLNLGITPLNSTQAKITPHPYFKAENSVSNPSNLDDDPIITPPVYGNFYRPGEMLNADNPQSWFDDLNLNPVYRVAAAQGTAVVQKDQEELMDRAWQQWGTYADTLKMRRRWLFSERLSQTMSVKRLKSMTEVSNSAAQYRSTSFFSPLIPTFNKDGATNNVVGSLVTTDADKPSTFSRAFSKVTRKGGPLMRRMSVKPAGVFFADIPTPVFARMPTTPLQAAINSILTWLTNNPGDSERLKKAGLAGIEQLKTAANLWLPYVSIQARAITGRTDVHKSTLTGLWEQIAPVNTIMARFEAMVRRNLSTGITVSTDKQPPSPVFLDATYAQLAERNTDFILPGLSRIPSNRVAILQANYKFIESYLVGLNHEMAREFLWREFPAPLNSTYFSQFWDLRNSVNAQTDIQPILQWKANTKIGTHGNTGGPGSTEEPIVVVIRGDLLRKYPNTEIFMAKADWENKEAGSHKLVLDVMNQSQWTIDSADLRRPLFSARIDPDYSFLGFNLGISEVKGNSDKPGWFFVMKERAGDTHFGLDLHAEPNSIDPSWDQLAEVRENQCIQVNSARFNALPRAGKRADQLASMLYQKPFMLFVHASRLLP